MHVKLPQKNSGIPHANFKSIVGLWMALATKHQSLRTEPGEKNGIL
jgi:hypothetical protein